MAVCDLSTCSDFVIPEAMPGTFQERESTGEVAAFEEIGRVAYKILNPVEGFVPSWGLARGSGKTMLGRDRGQLLQAAGILGVTAFGSALYGSFERMLGIDGSGNDDIC